MRQLVPTAKADKIKQAFAEMKEMQALFVEQPHFTILATKEIAGVCKRLEMGADLNIEEFLLLKRVLLASRELQSFYANLENVSLEEKAEGKYLAVAVSSIIARDLFLENLENLGRELGYQLPSGAGTASDKVASQILQAYGMQGLNFCAKLHFKNTEKAKKRLER